MDEEDETFIIVQHVQTFLEVVQTEFAAAAAVGSDGRWPGLDADARMRVAVKATDEIQHVQAAFARVRERLDSTQGKDLSSAQLEALVQAERDEIERLERVLADLSDKRDAPTPLVMDVES